MRTILRTRFGSHLYGTATPSSDQDFKSVFVPDRRSILLQRAKAGLADHRPKQVGEKNHAGEIDEEAFSLQRFLALAAEGQTIALDLLFAPSWAWIGTPGPEWQEIERNRRRLLTRKSAAFLGYCRRQANKYGIKGARVAAARDAERLLADHIDRQGHHGKLLDLEPEIGQLVQGSEHMRLVEVPGPTDLDGHVRTLRHWEVCDRKMPMTLNVKMALETVARIVADYGRRALQAESQQGVDWKALSHAVRVGTQAIELLTTGHLIFPRPNAGHLVAIKTGQRRYQEVATEIDALLELVEAAAASSRLPDAADLDWIDDFVVAVHYQEVAGGPASLPDAVAP